MLSPSSAQKKDYHCRRTLCSASRFVQALASICSTTMSSGCGHCFFVLISHPCLRVPSFSSLSSSSSSQNSLPFPQRHQWPAWPLSWSSSRCRSGTDRRTRDRNSQSISTSEEAGKTSMEQQRRRRQQSLARQDLEVGRTKLLPSSSVPSSMSPYPSPSSFSLNIFWSN